MAEVKGREKVRTVADDVFDIACSYRDEVEAMQPVVEAAVEYHKAMRAGNEAEAETHLVALHHAAELHTKGGDADGRGGSKLDSSSRDMTAPAGEAGVDMSERCSECGRLLLGHPHDVEDLYEESADEPSETNSELGDEVKLGDRVDASDSATREPAP